MPDRELSKAELKALLVEAGVPLNDLMDKLSPQETVSIIALFDDEQVKQAVGGVMTNGVMMPPMARMARLGQAVRRQPKPNLTRQTGMESTGQQGLPGRGAEIVKPTPNLSQETATQASATGRGPSGGSRGLEVLDEMFQSLRGKPIGIPKAPPRPPAIPRRRLK